MQPGSGGESGELSRSGGLARFRSAPATWLEALLESDEESFDVVLELPKPPFDAATDLELLDSTGSGGLSNFLRQNSSPAEFLSMLNKSDGCFSSLGIPASYGYPSTSAKRARQGHNLDKPSLKLSSSSLMPIKEENGGQGSIMLLDAEMDNLLEDSIMYRVRAKRGCATHPRSVAERMRRTRISDRIRKLQELVPDMDKQTNTADMLEEAVAYVKYLQKQIQEDEVVRGRECYLFCLCLFICFHALLLAIPYSANKYSCKCCMKLMRVSRLLIFCFKELTDHQKNCKCSSKY